MGIVTFLYIYKMIHFYILQLFLYNGHFVNFYHPNYVTHIVCIKLKNRLCKIEKFCVRIIQVRLALAFSYILWTHCN